MDRTLAGARLGLTFELADGIDQGLGITCRREPFGDAGDPFGEIGEHRIGHALAGKQQQRA